jgi:hypothetical protein
MFFTAVAGWFNGQSSQIFEEEITIVLKTGAGETSNNQTFKQSIAFPDFKKF